MSLTAIAKIVSSLLSVILPVITPEIKNLLTSFLQDLYKKAVATPNAWDDFLVKFLLDILGIPVPEVT